MLPPIAMNERMKESKKSIDMRKKKEERKNFYNIYNIYNENENKNFSNKIRNYIINNFIDPNEILERENLMPIYEILTNRIKYYDNKLINFYEKESNKMNKTNKMNKMNKMNNRININVNKNANIEIAKLEKKIEMGIIFFDNINSYDVEMKANFIDYWQLFGLIMLIIENEIILDYIDPLENVDKYYTLELFERILEIIINRRNYEKIKKYLECQNERMGAEICNDFFLYLTKRYCTSGREDILNMVPKVMNRDIHQLNNRQKKIIEKSCNIYGDEGKLKSECVKKALCQLVVYYKSRDELMSTMYKNISGKLIKRVLIYYIELIKIYSEINEKIREKIYKSGKLTSANVSKLNKFYQSKYRYIGGR